MSTAKRVLTSTLEMGRPTIVAETPQLPTQFSRTDFMQTLKKVSRRKSGTPSPGEASSQT